MGAGLSSECPAALGHFPPAPKSPKHPPASPGHPPHWRVVRRAQAKNAEGLAKAVVYGGEKLHCPSFGAQPLLNEWRMQGLAGISRGGRVRNVP